MSGIHIGSAFVDVTADTKGAFKGVDSEASAAGTKAGGLFKGAFGKGMAGMGAALAGAFAVDKITGFVGGAITGASNLNEEMSKSSVIFGKSSGDILSWSQNAAKGVGLSQEEALKATGTFGNMFSQLGFGGKAAANMSKDVVGLSADLGSFNNLPTSDVADRMGAAFRGEYDSIQALLPGINAASVEQQAMATTGKTNAKALTAQEKAAAVLALAHKGGAAAQGDFARTSGGLANQTKIAEANFKNMSASIGSVLLPVANGFMSFVNSNLIPGLTNIGSFIQTNVVPAIQQFATGFMQALPTIATVAAVIGAILLPALVRSAVQAAITAAANVAGWVSMGIQATLNAIKVVAAWVLMGFQSMIQAARMAAAWIIAMGPVGWVIALVVGLVAIIIANWSQISAFTTMIFTAIGAFISTVWNNIVTWISQAVTNIWNFVTTIFNNVRNFIGTVFNAVRAVVMTVWGAIVAGVRMYINLVLTIVTTIFNNVRTFIATVWNGIKTTISNVVNGVRSVVSSVFGTIRGIVSGIFNGVKSTISSIWTGIQTTIGNGVNAIRDTVKNVFGTLSGIMTGAFNGVSGTIRGVINGIIGAINGAIGGINSMIDIANKVPGVSIPHMGTIPGLYTGGTIKSSGMALVGERGPELVTLPRGATVHPNGVNPNAATSSSSNGGTTTIENTYHITIDAKNVKDFNSVVDIMNNLNQTARTGRGTMNARVA